MRSRWLIITLGVAMVAAVLGGWWWVNERRFRSELAAAKAELAVGRDWPARQRLLELTKRRPGSGEAAYLLGVCEEKLGHGEAAMASWSKVPSGSAHWNGAALGRARLLINTGRFAPAEDVLLSISRDQPSAEATQARQALELVLRLEGRSREVRALVLESWASASDPSAVLKRLHLLDDFEFPVDYVRRSLESADPDDDRVWLGRAALAVWLGKYGEAAAWLDRCARRRPENDQPIWLARLSLAMAAADAAGAFQAFSHLRPAWFERIEVLRLRAWYLGAVGDKKGEALALEALIAEEPGNTEAWARLAELAISAGRHAEAERFRTRQDESSQKKARYAQLIAMEERARHADELGRLARELGRPIEARGWSLIKDGRASSEPLWPPPERDARSRNPQQGLLVMVLGDHPPPAPARRPSITVAARTNAPRFVNDAEPAGLKFYHDNGHTARNPPPPETMCGGVALLDYDGDGWLDVYAVQGGPFPPTDSARGDGDRLFRNLGNGRFEDTTVRAGVAGFPRGYGHGVTVGDFDNDGHPDLFVTRWRAYALYRNDGLGRFEDVTVRVGLAGDRDWPTSAAFADLDGDGDLDLYVCHYLSYDPSKPRRCDHPESPTDHQCMPRDFPSLPDHVFRNDSGYFVDVTAEAGIVDPDGRGLGVVAADLDADGRVDLYVANDMSPNYWFRNLGRFRFAETGEISGAAVSADGTYKSGMGVACGDIDGDGLLDLAVTNFFGESTTFYKNLGHGDFVDQTAHIGLQAPSRPLLGFGVAFPDVDSDGWLDLLSTNGHVLDGRPRIPLFMRLQLMVGSPPAGHLTDVTDAAGLPFQSAHLGRGLAVGDIDNDGRLDAIVLNQNEPLVYLHNQTEPAGHFIQFSLIGTRSNRDGVGARVTVRAGGRARVAERIGGGSYQSASDPRLYFGLGDRTEVESVEVRWPSGQVDRHDRLAADHEYQLREGAPAVRSPRPAARSIAVDHSRK